MENNNKQTKSNGKTALIVFLLLVTIVAVILATYAWAKYTETFDNGEATAEVAKWNVSATSGPLTFSKTFQHVVEDKIAPGTDGSISASLNINDTEVDVDYTMTLVSVTPVGEGVIPENLVLKAKDGTVIYKNKAPVSSTNGVIATGRIAQNSANKSVEETFTWEWPFETGTTDAEKTTNNQKDTIDGKKAGSFKVTYTIDAVQVQPE